VKDSAGAERAAQVLATSAAQINFLVPPATSTGQATVAISKAGSVFAAGSVIVETVAPGLFSANATGKGVAAALAVRITGDGAQQAIPVFQCGPAAGSCSAVQIDLGSASEQVILSLFGTGMRGMTRQATATVGGIAVSVAGPVPQSQFAGLDQVNLGPLPRSLSGRGEVAVVLDVDAKLSNVVSVSIR
jgi:uncharacterized protein (TIGR03437 family)